MFGAAEDLSEFCQQLGFVVAMMIGNAAGGHQEFGNDLALGYVLDAVRYYSKIQMEFRHDLGFDVEYETVFSDRLAAALG